MTVPVERSPCDADDRPDRRDELGILRGVLPGSQRARACEKMGGLHSARCLLYSVDFAEIEELQTTGAWEEAGALLAAVAQSLEAAGAELLLLCTNTMHKVADAIESAVSIPLVHIADVVAEAVLAAGITRVGLLGTAFTMEQSFYRDRLATHGLEVIVPSADDRMAVHRIIYEELCLGVIREDSRQAQQAIIDRLVALGAEGIVLGCTELELLIRAGDVEVPVFPTTRLHAAAAVARALGSGPGDDLELLETAPDSEEAVNLVARYHEELAVRFPGGFDAARAAPLAGTEFCASRGCFLVARRDGHAVACGAVRKLTGRRPKSSACGSILPVRPRRRPRPARRPRVRGGAPGMPARALGHEPSSSEAISLYRSSGYREVLAYNDNCCADHWFEKAIGP